jgi:hypothetical protein
MPELGPVEAVEWKDIGSTLDDEMVAEFGVWLENNAHAGKVLGLPAHVVKLRRQRSRRGRRVSFPYRDLYVKKTIPSSPPLVQRRPTAPTSR